MLLLLMMMSLVVFIQNLRSATGERNDTKIIKGYNLSPMASVEGRRITLPNEDSLLELARLSQHWHTVGFTELVC